jgi:hypothetical protein
MIYADISNGQQTQDQTSLTDQVVTLQVDNKSPMKLNGYVQDNVIYIPAVTVLQQLDIATVWYEDIGALEIFVPENNSSGAVEDSIFRTDHTILFQNGVKYQLALAPVMKDGQLYLPADTLALLLRYQATTSIESNGWLLTWKG